MKPSKQRLLALVFIGTAIQAFALEEKSGEAIIAAYSDTQQVDSEMAYIKMTSLRPGLQVEERRFIAAYRSDTNGSDYLARLIHPRDIEGVTVLSKQTPDGNSAQYLYLPAVGKTRMLAGSAKSEPFLGSDFSIEDLLREAPASHNYQRLKDANAQGQLCYVVRAVEKQSSGSGYAYRDLYIAKNNYNLLQVDYYNLKEEMIKNFFAADYHSAKVKGPTTRPHTAIMIDKATRSTTTFTVIESRINEDVEAGVFTPEKIETWTSEEVNEFIFKFGFTEFSEYE